MRYAVRTLMALSYPHLHHVLFTTFLNLFTVHPNPLLLSHPLLACLEPILHTGHGCSSAGESSIVILDPMQVNFFFLPRFQDGKKNYLYYVRVAMDRTSKSEGRLKVCFVLNPPQPERKTVCLTLKMWCNWLSMSPHTLYSP